MDWKGFEENVGGLLSLQGWKVTPEHILGHKKVDFYIEKKVDFGRKVTYVVECKHYSNLLSKSDLVAIYTDYMPIIEKGKADSLLLVTINTLTPSAQTYVNDTRNLIHLTYHELVNSLMDFSTYINGLIDSYLFSGLESYYIPQAYETKEKGKSEDHLVEDVLLEWVDSDISRPIAILAGYGMGKTTLAQKLAYTLGQQFINDSTKRIPILIKLEDIFSDQSLEGLLGRHFTSFAPIQNYNFHTFMKLNGLGRFVIFLDGFDEMKRTMSWDVMRFNFKELNRLVQDKSKVIILGRPTAFLTEDEQMEALHGRRKLANKTRGLPGWPDYMEYYLLPFSEKEIQMFVSRYCIYLGRESVETQEILARESDESYGDEKSNRLISEIARRPVQLKMLIDILPEYQGNIDELTVTMLYSEFIDLIIRRELDKKSRQAFSIEQRRKFSSDLAFWMWKEWIGQEVTHDKIPDSLFDSFKMTDVPLDDIKRDLLSACFLEKKGPVGYYFPHRSLQEYLVAEKIASMIKSLDFILLDDIGFLTPELINFFLEMITKREVERWHKYLFDVKHNPSNEHIDLFTSACRYYGIEITKREINRLRGKFLGEWREISLNEFLNRARKRTKRTKLPRANKGVTRKKKYQRPKGKR